MNLDDYCSGCLGRPTCKLVALGGHADRSRSVCDACGELLYYVVRFRRYRRQGDGWLILPDRYGRLPSANETGIEVEIRAAELAAVVLAGQSNDLWRAGTWTTSEATGYLMSRSSLYAPLGDDEPIGWLVAVIIHGDEGES